MERFILAAVAIYGCRPVYSQGLIDAERPSAELYPMVELREISEDFPLQSRLTGQRFTDASSKLVFPKYPWKLSLP